MILYSITGWNDHFENAKSRTIKTLSYALIPNKQDGDGYTELMDHPNGTTHYGAWVAIVLAASKCSPRGTLIRDTGKPHDEFTLSRMTRVPVEVLQEALPRLLLIGWLTSEQVSDKDVAAIQDAANPKYPSREPEVSTSYPRGIAPTEGREGNVLKGTECKEGKATDTSRPGSYEAVTEEILRDDVLLDRWVIEARYRFKSLPAEADRLRVFSAAEQALNCGRPPCAVFVSIVRDRSWAEITNASEVAGEKRLKDLAARSRPPPSAESEAIRQMIQGKKVTA